MNLTFRFITYQSNVVYLRCSSPYKKYRGIIMDSGHHRLLKKYLGKNPGIITQHLLSPLEQWQLLSAFLWKGGEIVCNSHTWQ